MGVIGWCCQTMHLWRSFQSIAGGGLLLPCVKPSGKSVSGRRNGLLDTMPSTRTRLHPNLCPQCRLGFLRLRLPHAQAEP